MFGRVIEWRVLLGSSLATLALVLVICWPEARNTAAPAAQLFVTGAQGAWPTEAGDRVRVRAYGAAGACLSLLLRDSRGQLVMPAPDLVSRVLDRGEALEAWFALDDQHGVDQLFVVSCWPPCPALDGELGRHRGETAIADLMDALGRQDCRAIRGPPLAH